VTQFVVITEGQPLDRAAAEGWIKQLLPAKELAYLHSLRTMLALSLTDTAKVLLCAQSCPVPEVLRVNGCMRIPMDYWIQARSQGLMYRGLTLK